MQEATKNIFSWGNLSRFPNLINKKYFTLILKTMILTALVNSVTGTYIFTIQKQPSEVFLKFKSNFHKIHGAMPVSLFKKTDSDTGVFL